MNYELIIVGAGPAGLTAGLYGARSGLKTLLLEKSMPGGQAALTEIIENYPGYPQGVNGSKLMMSFLEQALRFGMEFKSAEVTSVNFNALEKKVEAGSEMFTAKAVILATGGSPKYLSVPGEKEFHGKGVSYCATCDGPFFPDKKLIVVGGGDSAIEEAIFLTGYAREVILVHRRDRLRAARVLQERAMKNSKLHLCLNSVVEKIEGEQSVQKVVLKNVQTGETKEENADGVFVFIGSKPNTSFLQGVIDLDDQGYIITQKLLMTSVPGVFAAGDVRKKFLRQVSTAVGDGAEAAMAAERYIVGLE
ncbi:MAG: thioredoxin-disulfide reductase [Bacillota bacterium]|jgi:thioredoxin reductase (NADPH)